MLKCNLKFEYIIKSLLLYKKAEKIVKCQITVIYLHSWKEKKIVSQVESKACYANFWLLGEVHFTGWNHFGICIIHNNINKIIHQ